MVFAAFLCVFEAQAINLDCSRRLLVSVAGYRVYLANKSSSAKPGEARPRRAIPLAIPVISRVANLSLKHLTAVELKYMAALDARYLEWLEEQESRSDIDPGTASPAEKAEYDSSLLTTNRINTSMIINVPLATRLKLMTAALNDFNKNYRAHHEGACEAQACAPFRMASMINEASRSTYKITPITRAEFVDRTRDHMVLSYFYSLLYENKNVGPFRDELFELFPETADFFSSETLQFYREQPNELWHRFIPSIDERLLIHFLFERGSP